MEKIGCGVVCGSPGLLLNRAPRSRIAWSDSYTCPLVWTMQRGRTPGYSARPQIEHTCARHLFLRIGGCRGVHCFLVLLLLPCLAPDPVLVSLISCLVMACEHHTECNRDSRNRWRWYRTRGRRTNNHGGVENPFITIIAWSAGAGAAARIISSS